MKSDFQDLHSCQLGCQTMTVISAGKLEELSRSFHVLPPVSFLDEATAPTGTSGSLALVLQPALATLHPHAALTPWVSTDMSMIQPCNGCAGGDRPCLREHGGSCSGCGACGC